MNPLQRRTTRPALVVAALAAATAGCGTSSQPASQPTSTVTVVASPTAAATATAQGSGSPSLSTSTGSASASSTVQSSHEGATPVTRDNLPQATDITFDGESFTTTRTDDGEGQGTLFDCQRHSWSELGGQHVFTREFTSTVGADEAGTARAGIASFATHAAALRAVQEMANGFTGCAARVRAQYPDLTTVKASQGRATLDGGQVAHLVALNTADGESGQPGVQEGAVFATGTHVELLVLQHGAQGLYGTEQVLNSARKAVHRLA